MPAAVEVMINADIYVGHTGGFGCSLDEYGNYRTSTDPDRWRIQLAIGSIYREALGQI